MDSVGRELETWLAQMPEVEPAVEAARQRIGRLSRLLARVVESVAAAESVSVGELETLSVIHRNGGSVTPGRIAAELRLTSGTVSTRIRRLEEEGLAQPDAPDPGDGRVRRVRLTVAGERVWRTCTARRTALERDLFDALGPADLTTLNGLLSELLDRFEQELGSVSRHDRI